MKVHILTRSENPFTFGSRIIDLPIFLFHEKFHDYEFQVKPLDNENNICIREPNFYDKASVKNA